MLERTDAGTDEAFRELRMMRWMLTRQQVATLKGQIKSGDCAGAIAGMERIKKRLCEGQSR